MYDENSNNASSTSAVNAAAVAAAAAAAANQSNVNGNGNVPVVPQAVNGHPQGGVPQVGGPPNAASINQLFTAKDPRWLQLEVCREFQRGQCSRSNLECKYAHPPPHVDVQNGRVTACYDSIKGRCTRENPKCKYLHPPQHLKDQLLINGRQSLALKTLLCSQLSQAQQAQNHPALAPVNLAQLVHPQQQLVQAMPYQYYPGLATIYPTLMQAPPQADPYQVQTPLQIAQMAALIQQQQQQQLAAAGLQNTASPVAFAAAAAAYQQQQHQAAAVAAAHAAAAAVAGNTGASNTASVTPSSTVPARKRPLGDDDVSPSTSAAAAVAAAANPLLLAAAVANGGVPCKRPTLDKNGASSQAAAVNAANLALYSQQQQFNPYLVPSLHGYVPAVSFSGQLPPPRY